MALPVAMDGASSGSSGCHILPGSSSACCRRCAITKTPDATGFREQGRGIARVGGLAARRKAVVVGQLALSLPLLSAPVSWFARWSTCSAWTSATRKTAC